MSRDAFARMPNCFAGPDNSLLSSFIFYWRYELTHTSDLLWLVFHKFLRSAPRQGANAIYYHSLDSAGAIHTSGCVCSLTLTASPAVAKTFMQNATGSDTERSCLLR